MKAASVSSLVNLITKEFSILVHDLIYNLGSTRLWMLNSYLERYPIRTPIAWWVFLSLAQLPLVSPLSVVTYQALRRRILIREELESE